MATTKTPRISSATRKAKDMSGLVVGALSPLILDTGGSLLAHAIRDLASGGVPDVVKGWLTGKSKPTEVEIQKSLDTLPAAERAKVERMFNDFKENAKIIDNHDGYTDEEKKQKINNLLQVYLAALPSGKKNGGSTAEPAVSLHETLASWSAEMHQLQREWFELIAPDQQDLYVKYMAHLAPALASQLAPYVPEKDTQRRASHLSDIESALKGRALEQYKLWLRTLDSMGRSHLSAMARSKRLTATIVERTLDLADVPAPKIADFEDFLDEQKLREKHDTFIRHISLAQRASFRGFRDRIHPALLKDKLSNTRIADAAPAVFIELENVAGTAVSFDLSQASVVLAMVEERQLDAPTPDTDKPKLDCASAKTIFRLIKTSIPKPKPTVGEQLMGYVEIGTDLMSKGDKAFKSLFPYEDLELPNFLNDDETSKDYVKRLVSEGALDMLRKKKEKLDATMASDEKDKRNKKFAKRLIKEKKFMSKVTAKINDEIREDQVKSAKR